MRNVSIRNWMVRRTVKKPQGIPQKAKDFDLTYSLRRNNTKPKQSR